MCALKESLTFFSTGLKLLKIKQSPCDWLNYKHKLNSQLGMVSTVKVRAFIGNEWPPLVGVECVGRP